MLILCREDKCAYNSDHIFKYSIEKDSSDVSNVSWDLYCVNAGDAHFLNYMTTYSSEENAADALQDLLINLEQGNRVYILKEDYDYAELCDESSLSGSNQTR